MNCEETREHLEACEDCRLHISVEARLRTQPVLEPPRGLAHRILRSLPRSVPMRREFARLAAAAAILVGLATGIFAFGLDQHEAMASVKPEIEKAFDAVRSAVTDFNLLERNAKP
jgi:hypothetical protein